MSAWSSRQFRLGSLVSYQTWAKWMKRDIYLFVLGRLFWKYVFVSCNASGAIPLTLNPIAIGVVRIAPFCAILLRIETVSLGSMLSGYCNHFFAYIGQCITHEINILKKQRPLGHCSQSPRERNRVFFFVKKKTQDVGAFFYFDFIFHFQLGFRLTFTSKTFRFFTWPPDKPKMHVQPSFLFGLQRSFMDPLRPIL